MVLSFESKDKTREAYNGRRIELQIRTELQHAWATTVEAIGLFRGENLKGSIGNADWLRLFQLMSSEFAQMEMSPLGKNMPGQAEHMEEIRELNTRLNSLFMLDSIQLGVSGTDRPIAQSYRPKHYIITYDSEDKTVTVRPHSDAANAVASYNEAESEINADDSGRKNIVLVEVDKIENLRLAYPNYFGDVRLFKEILRGIVDTTGTFGYQRVPRQPPAKPLPKYGDLSWLRGSRPGRIK